MRRRRLHFRQRLGRVGQVNVAGFSPVGVDVNYFRNDEWTTPISWLTWSATGKAITNIAFGIDFRRSN